MPDKSTSLAVPTVSVVLALLVAGACCGGGKCPKCPLPSTTTCEASDPYSVPGKLEEEFRDYDDDRCALPPDWPSCSAIRVAEATETDTTGSWPVHMFITGAIENGLCGDIVHAPGISDALRRVAKAHPDPQPSRSNWSSLEEEAKGAILVFERVREVSCKTGTGGIHGAFDPSTLTVKIYRSALDASTIYEDDITRLSVGFRYALILGHELGHALDAMTGDLMVEALCDKREERATIYGTYLAECFTRVMRIALPEWVSDPIARECITQQWKVYEYQLFQLRVALSRELKNQPNERGELQKKVAVSIACKGL